MKIIASCRTYQEERHIKQFCESYGEFADEILIADGMSTDRTVELALQYPNVFVRPYTETVTLKNGTKRNPDGPHVQFLVDWATASGGDWIIHQDCDQRPNDILKRDIRKILESIDADYLLVTQIFMWGKDKYFKDLSFQGGSWMQGLWAWRLSTGLRIIDKMPHYEFSLNGTDSFDVNKSIRKYTLLPPYCFMHFGWQTVDETVAHVKYYRETGLIDGMLMPWEFGGEPKPLESWMVE